MGKTLACPCQEPIHSCNTDLADSLGRTSSRRDDVEAGATASTPVLLGRTVNNLLSGSDSMDGGHEALAEAKVVVDNLGKRGKAVGRARCVRNNVHVLHGSRKESEGKG